MSNQQEESSELHRFQMALLGVGQGYIADSYERHREKLTEVTANIFLDRPGPTHLDLVLSRDEIFFQKLWIGVVEIVDSYERLLDIEVYLRRFPFRQTRVDRLRFLRFNIEAYLHEMYILYERLESQVRYLTRAYGKTTRKAEMGAALDSASKSVRMSLRGIIDTRGTHVHERRFSDRSLERLATVELFTGVDVSQAATGLEGRQLKWYADRTYREVRKEWHERITANNRLTRSLLDDYFDVLHERLFDQEGKLKFPDFRHLSKSGSVEATQETAE